MLLLPVKRMGVQAALFTVCLEAAKQLFVGTFCSLKNFLWPMGLQVFGHLFFCGFILVSHRSLYPDIWIESEHSCYESSFFLARKTRVGKTILYQVLRC